jgi:hypothetical protein
MGDGYIDNKGKKRKFSKEQAARGRATASRNAEEKRAFNNDMNARGSKARAKAAKKMLKVRQRNKNDKAAGREVVPF